MKDASFSRLDAESFLYAEAELIDDWKLDEWSALFTDDGRYLVHAANIPLDASPDSTLFYIADDRLHLTERVIRLAKMTAFAERPRSYVSHLITNVRVESTAATAIVKSNFLVHRWRDRTDTFVGQAIHHLDLSGGAPRIATKRCVLKTGNLHQQERVSIII